MQHHHQQLHSSSFTDWLPLLLILAIGLLYFTGTFLLQQRKSSWNHWRSLSFLTGVAMVAAAMHPHLMQWAHHDLRGHMVQHLLLAMFGPIFLVLGAPITLALKILPVKTARGITAILKTKLFYFFTHPITALILNIGGMYVLYLTPLYNQSLSNPLLHYLIHFHFFAAGYLFTWSIIGPDPVPNRPGLLVRVPVLLVSIALHAFLSKFMYAFLYPLHSPHSDTQIQEAAKLMYYWGDLSELLLTVILFADWYRKSSSSNTKLSVDVA